MGPKPPQYQPPQDDPQYLQLKSRAQADQVAATQETARIDSASLLARYGTLVSMANVGSPTAPGTVAPASSDAGSGLSGVLSAVISRMPRVA